MGHIEAAFTIHAPIETVWETLNDIENTPKWVVGLESAEIVSEGEYGRGTIYKDYNSLGPFLQTTAWQVTVFEPMSRQIHVSDSSVLPSSMILTLTKVTYGTYVSMSVDYLFLPRLGVLGRLLERMIMDRMLKSVLEQNLHSLNQYLHPEVSANTAKSYQ